MRDEVIDSTISVTQSFRPLSSLIPCSCLSLFESDMKINAAILWEQGAPLSVEEAELEAPRAGEVLVEVKAAGVCHSDLNPARGDWPARTPLVLGHEGAGFVREVGEGVSRLREGDRVVFCWAPPCGHCPPCL